ncbi:MAG: hypothetical protein ABI175_18185 [Polyangiales bacterium]
MHDVSVTETDLRALLGLLGLLVPVIAPAIAHADDTFEAKATGARSVIHVDDIVWSLTATCDKGDDVQNRQCRSLRDQRAKDLAGQTLLVQADGFALDLGAWDSARKSVGVTLTSCIRCEGLGVDGKTWFITGGAPKVENGKVRGAPLYDTARQFATPETAAAWLKAVKNHKVELVVKIPAKPRWNAGGKDGIQLDVLAYRVITPCNGTVVIANPSSQNAAPDKAACAAGGAAVLALTPEMIEEGMQAPMSLIRSCAKSYRGTGKGKLDLTIADDGTIAAIEQTGDFVGSKTGECIDRSMKGVTFPRSAKPKTKIAYPFVLP